MRIVITVLLFIGAFIGFTILMSRVGKPEEERIETELTVLSIGRSEKQNVTYITSEEFGPQTKIRIPSDMQTKLKPGQRYRFFLYRDKNTGEPIWAVRILGE